MTHILSNISDTASDFYILNYPQQLKLDTPIHHPLQLKVADPFVAYQSDQLPLAPKVIKSVFYMFILR